MQFLILTQWIIKSALSLNGFTSKRQMNLNLQLKPFWALYIFWSLLCISIAANRRSLKASCVIIFPAVLVEQREKLQTALKMQKAGPTENTPSKVSVAI